MTDDLCRSIVERFLQDSFSCIQTIVNKLANGRTESGNNVHLFRFTNGQRIDRTFDRNLFFLRTSVEYSNPQITLEEIQGIIGARLLEVCGEYFNNYGIHKLDSGEIAEICESLKKPSPAGSIIPFLLNTDEIEADRYSMNPLKESIVSSGQSAFPVANVKTAKLKVDSEFMAKYEGKLISKKEAELVECHLDRSNGSYLDFVDSLKYAQMMEFSEIFGIDLSLWALRMPLATLQAESKNGLLHRILSDVHSDYDSISQAYNCMGRSMSKRTTLLTVPHSSLGHGSKRAARGRLHFEGIKLKQIVVKYQPTRLYPNEIDPTDISLAEADSNFIISGEQLADYSFIETPSSPQFFLYSLGSPEDAVLWHGIGAFAAPKLLRSYVSARRAYSKGNLIKNADANLGVKTGIPLQFNLAPDGMWIHPVHRNIDASIGCVQNPEALAQLGMHIESLPLK